MTSPTRFAFPLSVALTLAALCHSEARAQQASFTTFGTPCAAGGARAPAIGHRGLPQLGTTLTVTYAGPNSIVPGIQLTEQPTLVLSFARVDLAVPQFLVTQPAGCTLYPALDVVEPMPPDPSGQRYVTSYDLRVPNDPGLSGATLYVQWMTPRSQCAFVGCGLMWVVFSDAARAVIGT